MGVLLNARCACGYHADHVLAGMGEVAVEYAPGRCAHCHTVQSVPVERGALRSTVERLPLRCPRCGGTPVLYELGDVYDLDPGDLLTGFTCPRCSGPSLTFQAVGVWD